MYAPTEGFEMTPEQHEWYRYQELQNAQYRPQPSDQPPVYPNAGMPANPTTWYEASGSGVISPEQTQAIVDTPGSSSTTQYPYVQGQYIYGKLSKPHHVLKGSAANREFITIVDANANAYWQQAGQYEEDHEDEQSPRQK